MITSLDIQEMVERIAAIWNNPNHRNGRFGNALKSITIHGVRGIEETIEFGWPVTALAGTNGSGKTTVLQLCSSAFCLPEGGRPYRLGDWFRNSIRGDTIPVKPDAEVSYTFWDDTGGYQIPYKSAKTRWGYRRRGNPTRHVSYVGVSYMAPRIERPDQMGVFRPNVTQTGAIPYTAGNLQSLMRVMSIAYTGGSSHGVALTRGSRKDSVQQVTRDGTSYSETNMGAGEQKIARLIQKLESLPDKALILLEEPEVTLHSDAQRGLAWYLMNVCLRKGHQVILATHSSEIYETLPIEARVMLVRDAAGVRALYKVAHLRAARELDSSVRANRYLILVEDDVAVRMLEEVLRRYARNLLGSSAIVDVGNSDDVRRMTLRMRGQGVRAVGVRDCEQEETGDAGLLSLPGGRSPEGELLDAANIGRATRYIEGIEQVIAKTEIAVADLTGVRRLKRQLDFLSNELAMPKTEVADRLTLAWLEGCSQQARLLATNIQTELEKDLTLGV